MVFQLLIPVAIFALWAIPKTVDNYDNQKKKHTNRKKGKN